LSRNAKRISIITAALIVLATAIASQVVRPAWPDGRVPVISAAGVGEFLEAVVTNGLKDAHEHLSLRGRGRLPS